MIKKIDLTKEYKTKGGLDVWLYKEFGKLDDYPVSGYIFNNSEWVKSEWTESGKFTILLSPTAYDLVEVKVKEVSYDDAVSLLNDYKPVNDVCIYEKIKDDCYSIIDDLEYLEKETRYGWNSDMDFLIGVKFPKIVYDAIVSGDHKIYKKFINKKFGMKFIWQLSECMFKSEKC